MKVSSNYYAFYDEIRQCWYGYEYHTDTDSLTFYETEEPNKSIIVDVDEFKEKIANLYGILNISDDDTISYLDEIEEAYRYQLLEEEEEEEETLVPNSDNDMPSWYTMYKEYLGTNGGRQGGIRQTFQFNDEEWKKYFCDSSYQTSFIAGHSIAKNILQNKIVKESYSFLKKISR